MRKRPEEPESLQNTPKDEEGFQAHRKNRCIYSIKKTSTKTQSHILKEKQKNKNTSSTAKFHAPGITGERLLDNTCNIHV